MSRRKGEITTANIKRNWPYQVALSADKVRGLKNSETVGSFADTLSVAQRQLHMCRDNVEFVIVCFAKPDNTEAFAKRFDGERPRECGLARPRVPGVSGRTEGCPEWTVARRLS
jgi:hypothetical protein